jgi:Alpha-L-arabinofuranosidase B, catalytic
MFRRLLLAALLVLAPLAAHADGIGFRLTFPDVAAQQPASVGLSFTPPLNAVPGNLAAYCFRLCSSTYTGNAINIRRASDSTAINVGLLATGALNTAAATAFCASTTCFLTEWYDQSGHGYNMTQATAANQAQLVFGAAPNGQACAQFVGTSSQTLAASGTPTAAQPLSLSVVADRNGATSSRGIIYELGPTGAGEIPSYGYQNSANEAYVALISDANFTATASDNAFHVIQPQFAGASSSITVDGTATSGSLGTSGAGSGRTIGTDGFGDNLTADVCELLEYGALTTTQQGTLRANEKAYYGTP